MRLPRMTTRRWIMVVVAVALVMAVIVGGLRLRQRREALAIRAIGHAMRKAECEHLKHNSKQMLILTDLRNNILSQERSLGSDDPPRPDKGLTHRAKAAKLDWHEEAVRMDRAIAYHAAMQRKYEDAAQRPWLPVEPDPPEPR
jgi:hypothetical protein